jgi:hypothetical protein
LAGTTIDNALSSLVQTFRNNDRPNPTLDADGKLGRLLQQQKRAYANKDPAPKQQKALPCVVLKELARMEATEVQKATAQLAIGGFFFACRSCEYLKVPQAEKKRTDILRLRCIRFFDEFGQAIKHSSPDLERAHCVSITFERQKKDEKMDTVTQIHSGDPLLCPVRSWAAVVKRIWGYEGASLDTPVSAVWRNGRIEHVTSGAMIVALDAAVGAVGYERLGIKKGEIGTHSLRSGAAMAMYLGEVPVYTIMMLGRWSSDAFLRYIRKQVEQFSHNVSKRMIIHQFHRHMPDADPRITHHDPRQRNHPNNAATRGNIGGDGARRARLPAMSLYY